MVEETKEEPESEADNRSGDAGPSAPIRVLIADDHPVVRDGLRHALAAPDVEVVGEAATGREALAAAHRLNPDILVLDIRMPVLDGLPTAGVGDLPQRSSFQELRSAGI
jgi:PleD family two-component response regulator